MQWFGAFSAVVGNRNISVSQKNPDSYLAFFKTFDFSCQNTSGIDIDMSKHAAAFKNCEI